MDSLRQTISPSGRNGTQMTRAIERMKFSSLCNRLKAHLLVHLPEDIERFAGGPFTETERCEQQHKFMRQLLCHTNRQNGGRDVAIRFAEEYMLRHISRGGLFKRDASSQVWESPGTAVVSSYTESP